MDAVQESDRASAAAAIQTGFARLNARCPRGNHLTKADLEVIIGNFGDRETRHELADLAARDDFDEISSADVVHPWFVRPTNTRHAAAHDLRRDIINAMRLCDRLSDTVSFFVQVEPETMDGTRYLDARTDPALETYLARAIRSRGGTYEETYQIMLEAFRHGIAVWHVSDFTARKEHTMRSGRYRNKETINVLNAHSPCDFVAVAEGQPASLAQTEAFARFEGRRRWQAQR
ncbi:hypothetical protein AURDEDRAFT_157520 [Auricularia subglabra TFB-10046 SS5]|nr:hypothetical protein AURDEDRAFT_157520 [Auricularia subglabra TFB-10046 SS5]